MRERNNRAATPVSRLVCDQTVQCLHDEALVETAVVRPQQNFCQRCRTQGARHRRKSPISTSRLGEIRPFPLLARGHQVVLKPG